MSSAYSTSSIFSSSSPSMSFSSSSSNSTSTQGVDKSIKDQYQDNFDERYQNIFQIMLQTTSLPEDVAALCTNFTESMEPKNVPDGYLITFPRPTYTLLMRTKESPLVKAAKNLPDGALNSFILMLGKTSFTTKELLSCLQESIRAKKIGNVRFLLDKSNHFNIEEDVIDRLKKEPTNTSLLDTAHFEELLYLFGLDDQELANYLMENMPNEENYAHLKVRAYLPAISSGNLELVKSLEDKDVIDILTTKRLIPLETLLIPAVASGSIEMLEYITQKFNIDLKKNINNYTDGIPLIFNAVNPFFKNHSCCSMIDYLVKKEADLKIKSRSEETIFHYAAKNSDIEVLKHLRSILPGVSMDEITGAGDTPLSIAAFVDNFPAVKYIIENENVSSESIAIAIRSAAGASNVKILKYLVNHNPNVNTQDTKGDSPVDLIALQGNLELVQFLVSKGSKIRARTLRYAAESGNLELVKYLVGKGASFNALDLQNKRYSREIFEYLREQQKIKSWNWKTVACVSIGLIATVSSVAVGIFYRR
jgi:ankyrin repeat protein